MNKLLVVFAVETEPTATLHDRAKKVLAFIAQSNWRDAQGDESTNRALLPLRVINTERMLHSVSVYE